MQTIEGMQYQIDLVQRINALFMGIDYYWERDSEGNRLMLVGTSDAEGSGEIKKAFLQFSIIAEGYGS